MYFDSPVIELSSTFILQPLKNKPSAGTSIPSFKNIISPTKSSYISNLSICSPSRIIFTILSASALSFNFINSSYFFKLMQAETLTMMKTAKSTLKPSIQTILLSSGLANSSISIEKKPATISTLNMKSSNVSTTKSQKVLSITFSFTFVPNTSILSFVVISEIPFSKSVYRPLIRYSFPPY